MKKHILLYLIFCFNLPNIFGQSCGIIDSTFGTNGKIITDLNNNSLDNGECVLIQPDGKIILAGGSYNGTSRCAMVRYLQNGDLDLTFGNNGIVLTTIRNGSMIYSAVLQPDGKIVAAGTSFPSTYVRAFTVVRYNSNGQIDNTFGTNGYVCTQIINADERAVRVKMQSDGKIIITGETHSGVGSNYNFALIRYNSNGTLDNSFGNNGIVTTDLGNDIDYPRDILIQNDGKIIVTGKSGQNFATVRYNTNGSIDNTFGFSGIVFTSFGSDAGGQTLTLQPDNKIIVAGYVTQVIFNCFAIVRYNNNGSIDNSFGNNGKIIKGIGPSYSCKSTGILLLPDGRFVIGGISNLSGWGYFSSLLYKNSGSLDSTYGYNGYLMFDFGYHYDECNDIAIQSNGKIILAGTGYDGQDDNFAMARVIVDESLNINENFSFSNLIYPNPVKDRLYVNSNSKKVCIEIINLKGIKVLDKTLNNENCIDLKNLPVGIYFIKINLDNKTYIQKIIKI